MGSQLGETIVTESKEANYRVCYTPASMYIGFQMGGKYSVGRIANISTTTDSKPLTDDLLSDLISLFPANMGPQLFVMNRTRLKDLQQGRTATNPTGAPAPFPDSAFNVPIVVTDALVDTEAVET